MIETCQYCNTDYTLPEHSQSRHERTTEGTPPNWVRVYAVPLLCHSVDYDLDPVIHECRRGEPTHAASTPQ